MIFLWGAYPSSVSVCHQSCVLGLLPKPPHIPAANLSINMVPPFVASSISLGSSFVNGTSRTQESAETGLFHGLVCLSIECVNSDLPFTGPKGSNLHCLVTRWKLSAPVTETPAATFVANSSRWRSVEDSKGMATVNWINRIKNRKKARGKEMISAWTGSSGLEIRVLWTHYVGTASTAITTPPPTASALSALSFWKTSATSEFQPQRPTDAKPIRHNRSRCPCYYS